MTVIRKRSEGPLIKNERSGNRRSDFFLGAVGLAALALVACFALAATLVAGVAPSAVGFGIVLGTPLATALLMTLFPRWDAAVKLLLAFLVVAAAAWGAAGAVRADISLALALAGVAALIAPAAQKKDEWERAIVLRFGRFNRVAGPGLFLLVPLADRVARVVDLRIRVTDFSAETTLTRDSVTITVDALCFWLVWDAEKAVCEVESYEEAVVLSAKTALRAAVSKNDLTTFLERGEEIEDSIRAEVDRKTTDWGVTVQHIEITDIQIPKELQDSMSRLAQAEREKKGRVLLAEAEIEIARRLEEASRIYDASGTAMKLKSLSILNEGLKAGSSMMLVPNSITEELRTKDVFGLEALAETRRRSGASEPPGGSTAPEGDLAPRDGKEVDDDRR